MVLKAWDVHVSRHQRDPKPTGESVRSDRRPTARRHCLTQKGHSAGVNEVWGGDGQGAGFTDTTFVSTRKTVQICLNTYKVY